MRYEIVLTKEAKEDLGRLVARDRSKVVEAIETHLRFEPEKTSKSRIKRLEDYEWPKYRLRVDEVRVFYDVIYTITEEAKSGRVEVLVIREKSEAMEWLAEFGKRTPKDEASTTEGNEG
ncbi:MAG: type II toxin-antitoxin system RelE/ParE family toxin [Anaerolineae bacterium]|nr:type II toxin-antitoxin system RelE/ParE family toxin [Anaerolineae bacterium]